MTIRININFNPDSSFCVSACARIGDNFVDISHSQQVQQPFKNLDVQQAVQSLKDFFPYIALVGNIDKIQEENIIKVAKAAAECFAKRKSLLHLDADTKMHFINKLSSPKSSPSHREENKFEHKEDFSQNEQVKQEIEQLVVARRVAYKQAATFFCQVTEETGLQWLVHKQFLA